MSGLAEAFQAAFRAHADPAAAQGMRAYMRDQFPFLGIKTPERRALTRLVLRSQGEPEAEALYSSCLALWALPEREYQYAALDLLARKARRLSCGDVPLLERFILAKPWWDTVDALAKLVGEAFRRDQSCRDRWLSSWRSSDDLWLRRAAILFQLAYKGETDRELLGEILRENARSSEFFIQKASGWALREYAKTDREWVEAYVERTPLSALSRREALKRGSSG